LRLMIPMEGHGLVTGGRLSSIDYLVEPAFGRKAAVAIGLGFWL
jgi:hypothetical protein